MIFKNQNIQRGIEVLANWMLKSENTVILTGAGMDTESNIPDFRGKDGWWKNIDPRQVASINTFNKNYSLFHEFYSMRINLLKDIKPHKGHYILADLENRGMINSIATQNVSGLHYLAGSKKVYELHGNIQTVRCNHCGSEGDVLDFLDKKNCNICGKNALRPNVVLFGEGLPMESWHLAEKDIRASDLLIIIGTSLEVYPVNQLPLVAMGKTVFINNEDINLDYGFDIKIIGKAGDVLEKLDNYLNSHF